MYAKRFFISKSFYQGVSDRYIINKSSYQGVADRNTNRNFSQSSRSFFDRQKNAYQNNAQNRLSQIKITFKVDNLKKSEREFDRDDRNNDFKERYRKKSKHRERKRFMHKKNKKKIKVKTYLAQQDYDDENDSNDDYSDFLFLH